MVEGLRASFMVRKLSRASACLSNSTTKNETRTITENFLIIANGTKKKTREEKQMFHSKSAKQNFFLAIFETLEKSRSKKFLKEEKQKI